MELELLQHSNDHKQRTGAEKAQMIKAAADAYGKFLTALGFDWQNDEHTKDTPNRVAKAWINDLISGCVNDLPKIKSFPNKDGYTGLICQTNIDVVSMCAHHNLPFVGKAHVAYIPGKGEDSTLIGLSKLNRIVDWYSRRPTVQESLTKQIADKINELCEGNRGVAVVIESQHNCVRCRGIKQDSTMVTSQLEGYFHTNEVGTRVEFFNLIGGK